MELIRPDGFLFIQTPCYPIDYTYDTLLNQDHPFLKMLQPLEHVYLFNKNSIIKLMQKCGLSVISFEKALFEQYDMFLVASLAPITTHTQEEIDQFLEASPTSRLILALVDLYEKYRVSEIDRLSRWDQIQQYSKWLKESEAIRENQLKIIKEQTQAINDLNKIESWIIKGGKKLGLWKTK